MAEPVNPELVRIRQELFEKHSLYLAMLKEKAGKNLYLFNKYVLGAEKGDENFVPLGAFHKTLCNFVQDRPDKKKLILIPRSHLKTKLISTGYPVFKIAQNPKIRILVASATWQMAVDIHTAIQKTLQGSETLIEIWGDFSKEATIWSQDNTRLAANDKREPTITAAGVDKNLVGGHYDLILCDDIVNRDNVATMDQISKVITRYRDYLDLLEPHGEMIIIGTRWHDADLYGWLMEPGNQSSTDFLTLIMKAYEGNLMTGEDFSPLWPGKFDREGLLKKLRGEGWAHFSSQYLNDPVPEEDAIFKRSWFHYYEADDVRGKLFNKFLLIDPAISLSKDADYTAMIVVGVDEYNNLFILDVVRARLSPSDIINQIFRLRDLWHLQDVAMEQVAFQKAIGYSLRDDIRFKKQPFHITELKPNERSKDTRIKGLQPLYENGKVFHNKQLANNIYLEDELVRFPRSSHDDLIDAFAYALDIIYPAKQVRDSRNSRRKYLYR